MMITDAINRGVMLCGEPHSRRVLLEDVNIPYKFTIDRNRNNLFFCINADDFSDQSFQSVVLSLDNGSASIIPGIRNGFASAVDQATGTVYLGGSEGIFKYNNFTKNVDRPALVAKTDILDMYFHENLYFVDTAKQSLYVLKNNQKEQVPEVRDILIQHFVFDANKDLYFVNSVGLFLLQRGSKTPLLLYGNDVSIRGVTTDVYGKPYFVAQDGIYTVERESKLLIKVLPVDSGYGVAFDKYNNIIYSDDRSVTILIRY